MSRRKVRGLTRTGRQVSEDPDIDNLLSTLSPEEMEELEKEVMTVPDSDPNEIFEARQRNQLVKQPSVSNNREAKLDPCEHDTKRLPQRELSFEGEPRKESRKQEYLRKMGLSQEKSFSRSESQDGGLQRQDSVSTEGERKMEDRNCKDREDPKGNQVGPSERFRRMEIRDKVTPEQTSKTKEEEEEDEAASMFDEPLEKVRKNDPSMTELNVNNSEVIKTKTLIQFAEALKDNTHVKTFSLANTRADDHVAYAIAGTLRSNKTITSINLDSNHLTNKGIMSLIQALQHNATLTELRFHNQRHICGGKTEMEMVKVLKENTTLLKLGYHFELAGPRMTMTNILSRNMDRQRQRRLQEQKQAQANGEKKGGSLEVPKAGGAFLKGSPKASPQPSPQPSPLPSPLASPRVTPKRGGGGGGAPPPPAPPPPPPAPLLEGDFLRNSLSPASQRKLDDRGAGRGGGKNSRDQLLASIRASNIKQLKKVAVPKLLQ
ncbi:hypothetical protein MATL_G00073300 [Megalops atlanticus]|uniref:Leiomodin-1 n=1 Tax=Megalops atlanticus TaxID=7932 RepID=A0A9D3QA53_MEGAT|nr:hypothetical protein MATL_G00073300 [Megalops atlanticus]